MSHISNHSMRDKRDEVRLLAFVESALSADGEAARGQIACQSGGLIHQHFVQVTAIFNTLRRVVLITQANEQSKK